MGYKRYEYNGPVLEFGKVVDRKWASSTVAQSVAKARTNLVYQYKKSHGKTVDAKISLPGKIIAEDGEDE